MKVLLINGSHKSKVNTYLALLEVAFALITNGVESVIIYIDTKVAQGCIACNKCNELDRCVF